MTRLARQLRSTGFYHVVLRDVNHGHLGHLEPSAVASLAKQERDATLALLREKGFSLRHIERATGISRGIISRAK